MSLNGFRLYIATLMALLGLSVFNPAQAQTTTARGRYGLVQPDLGYPGGSGQHALLATIYTNIGDNLIGRWTGSLTLANAASQNFTHNFNLPLANLKFIIIEAPNTQLTAQQAFTSYVITQNSVNQVNIQNVSGSTKTFAVTFFGTKLGVVAADLDPDIAIDTTVAIDAPNFEARNDGALTFNSDAAGSGADWTANLTRPTSGQTANSVITLPAATGTLSTLAGVETLTNKKLRDDSTYFTNAGDPTKRMGLVGDLATTGTLTTIFSQSTVNQQHRLPDATSGLTTILTTDVPQVVTEKDIDGGIASNARRLTIPKDTLTNLTALTRKAGTILYATDGDGSFYKDNGTTLEQVGAASVQMLIVDAMSKDITITSTQSAYYPGNLVVPTGKTLTVNGTLYVKGTVSGPGTITGTGNIYSQDGTYASPTISGPVTSYAPAVQTSVKTINTGDWVSNAYSVTTSDQFKYFRADTSTTARTLNLPTCASNPGRELDVKLIGSAPSGLTLDPFSAENIEGASTFLVSGFTGFAKIFCNGTSWEVTSHGVTQNPGFRAYVSSTNNIPDAIGTDTKVIFASEDWDVGGYYDTSNGRYTPKVAGDYLITSGLATINGAITADDVMRISIFKNGSTVTRNDSLATLQGGTARIFTKPAVQVVQMNGTTDYIEIYASQACGCGNLTVDLNTAHSWFEMKYLGR